MDSMAKEHTFSQAYHMSKITSWLDRGGDVNETSFSKQGHTFLMQACVQNHEALVCELIRRGADLDYKGRVGKTALILAATFGNDGCVSQLLRAGANPLLRVDEDDTEYTENDGMTALEIVEAEIKRDGCRPRTLAITRMLRDAASHQQHARAQQSSAITMGR